MKLTPQRLSYKYGSTSRTLDAAIANCNRAIDGKFHPGVPSCTIHRQFWTREKLGALMAVKNRIVPFVVVG